MDACDESIVCQSILSKYYVIKSHMQLERVSIVAAVICICKIFHLHCQICVDHAVELENKEISYINMNLLVSPQNL